MNPTKKSFLTSVIALVLCLTMFLGTTFAWFTDMVTSSGNIIQTGSLKIDLELLDKETGKWNSIKDSQSPLFDYEKWEPGYVDVKVLKVENEGTLSLKWKAMFVSDEQLSALADVIDVYVLPWGVGNGEGVGYPADRKLDGYTKVGTLKDFVNTIESTTYGTLKGGEAAYLGIALKMQDEAGNDYQQLSLGKFNIQIVATQAVGESDSFDNNYDANAQWPELESGYSASTAVDTTKLILGALTEEMTIGGNNGVGAIIPADVKVEEGATSLQLTMNKVEDNFVLGDNVSSFDVHISGIASDNVKPMRVDLGAVLATGLTDTELKLYHIENGTPVQMTRVATVSDFALHNQYTYDSATGNVSIYVKSFSVFSAVNTSADTWDGTVNISWYNNTATSFTLTTAEQFAGFRAIVDGGYYTVADGIWTWNETAQDDFDGKTVMLGNDINLMNILFDPIGFGYESSTNKRVFKGTFDGKGYSIYNLKQNGWDLDPNPGVYDTYTYSTAGAGLFASVVDADIKNVTINGADIVYECVDMGILVGYAYGTCNFENIIITNSKIANYNRYTGGVVGEVNGTHNFDNIIVDTSVKISALWGTFDPAIGGVIGGKYGSATVNMTNVTVGAELDVFSDVTAAYQWYAYRRCGMLIGQTEMSDPNNAHLAYAPFLTCENVKVYYGDWVNYTYYMYDNQSGTNSKGEDVTWQNKYPWVRAEAGEHNGAFSNARYGNPVVNSVAITDGSNNTGTVEIPFNQLYGGGQGVYGQANHEGVTRVDEFTKTIYFKNEWNWSDVRLYYWYEDTNLQKVEVWHNAAYPGVKMEWVANDGTYDYYRFALPAYVDGFKITDASTLDENGVAPDDKKTSDIHILDVEDNEMFYMLYNSTATNKYQVKSENYQEYCNKYTVVKFKPNSYWATSGRYAAYIWKSTNKNDNKWLNMSDIDKDGYYSCWVPNGYDSILFARMKSGTDNNWNNRSNQTADLKMVNLTNNTYVMNEEIYLKPNSNWNVDNARFAAYFFGNGEKWVSMVDREGDGVYECEIPSGYTKVIFCRMNPGTSANNWNNKWNQTGDLTIPTGGGKLFTVPSGAWDGSTSGWSK